MSLLDLLNPGEESNGDRIDGVMIGIVTNNKDLENMGRVKVKFPCSEIDDQSHWARVATLMAGKDRGSYFLPEIGDEVLVAFEHGDINHPFIIGALWNGNDKPPGTNENGKNDIRKFKSKSGHELIFDDEKHKEKVVIHTKAGHTIVLDDSSGSEKIEIKDKNGVNTIVMDSVQRGITIESSMFLKIKSKMIEIEADCMMTLKSKSMLTIQGLPVKIN
ncbi:phage tail protein [Bacillus pseudomycoides]|uniref:phage baseplate assembly protein V n=1 Tax=Bacillus pseudomycoides TaxID=64104 RepID=UPI000BEBE02F|nr:phage baseplate assembly protein V [Bacillus pseudomycoides]MBD5799848.1 phage tail protein [Bacillus pseudomycoides]MED1476530.1 phage baseplate assembly protein V [Bacillus pseudomycoides]PDZ13449.1 phage tail protein [Bacillus pseudomycoides]PEO78115.1 phage tail protein [Bacillus pseudomycoides]